MPKILRAKGSTTVTLRFDPATIAGRNPRELEPIAYHFKRLLTGEGTAEGEWNYLGVEISVEADSRA